MVSEETASALRGLGTGDLGVVEELVALQELNLERSGLDARSYAFIKLASLIAVDAPPASYVGQVAWALDCGVSPEEILGVLVAVAPQVGLPKAIAAAPEIALALGLSLDEEA
jgi:alkylhydroperoxidase/carboxymuconolactone decarboxylase family protein YurZ